MKTAIFSLTVLATLTLSSTKYINLGPAYNVDLNGTNDWKLLRTYSKDPYFVEGFELVNDNTLLQSAGLYSGSQIQMVGVNNTNAPLSSSVTS